jgi:NADPH-dependent 2,4-dienoyl-CoA reductase/sulfur reductase-like enzyme
VKGVPPHHVIIGSGIAGLTAAETLREHDPSAAITLISEESHDFYSRPGLAYLLRGDIPEKQLFVRTRDDLRELNIDRLETRVEQLLPEEHEVVLAGGARVRYDRLLLATGATAVPAAFPGGDLAGVVKLDSLDDARHILKLARRGQTAVVVGGGITALELAEGLLARRMRVHYFLRSERYWSDVLDETESHIILERLREEGIVLHFKTQVAQALGTGGRLVGVETQAGEQIPCEVLAVAIGVRPRIELARAAGLLLDRGVVVNAYLQTSAPDVFAAGDVAQVFDPVSGCATIDVLWSTALAQGKVAGANMAGASLVYVKGIPFNVTQLAGLKVTIIGAVGKGKDADLVTIARGDSEAWRLLPQAWVAAEQDDVNRVRILFGERRIVGALVMGDQTWSRPLQRLIVAQVDITPVRAALLSDSSTTLARLADFYQQWEHTHGSCAGRPRN